MAEALKFCGARRPAVAHPVGRVKLMHTEMRQGFQRLDARIDKQGDQIDALLYEQQRLLVTTNRVGSNNSRAGSWTA